MRMVCLRKQTEKVRFALFPVCPGRLPPQIFFADSKKTNGVRPKFCAAARKNVSGRRRNLLIKEKVSRSFSPRFAKKWITFRSMQRKNFPRPCCTTPRIRARLSARTCYIFALKSVPPLPANSFCSAPMKSVQYISSALLFSALTLSFTTISI